MRHNIAAVICSLLAVLAIGYLVSNMPPEIKFVPPTYADAFCRAMVMHGDLDDDSFFTIEEEITLNLGFLYYLIAEKNVMIYSLDADELGNVSIQTSVFIDKITEQKVDEATLIQYLFDFSDWLTLKKNPPTKGEVFQI